MMYDGEEFWEVYEERAAIMEFDAYDIYSNRQEAEEASYADICENVND